MKFMLPKIFGLAIITGIGAILLAAIFKMLILIGIVGTIIYWAASRFSRHRQMQQYGMHGMQGFDKMSDTEGMYQNKSFFYKNNVMPVGKNQRTSGIIPIN